MDAPLIYAGIAFAGALALVFAVSALANRRQPAVVRRRLDQHAVEMAVVEAKRLERVNVLKDGTFSAVPLMDHLLRRVRPARTALKALIRADAKLTVPQYFVLRIALAVALWAGLRVILPQSVYALIGIPVGLIVPRVVLWFLGNRRLAAFENQLAEAIDLLVGSLKAGHGFLQGLEAVAKEMGNPMRRELRLVLDLVNVGVAPADALQTMTERIDSYDLRLFASAVAIQRTAGGNLAEVLENLAHTVRERRRIRGEVKAITTGPRVSSYVLGLLPVALLVWFVVTNVDYRAVMVESVFGRVMVIGATIWSLIGFFLAQKMAKVEY